MRALNRILLVSALVACGGGDDDNDDDAVTVDAAAGTPDAPGADAPPAAADAAAPDAADAALSAAITDVQISADCMPIVPPDPVAARVTVQYDNTAGPASASIAVTEVELTWNDGDGMVATQKIAVAPALATIPAAGTMAVMHSKTSAIDDLANDCAYCDSTVKVSLSFTVDGGAPQVISGDGTMDCVF